MSEQTAVLEGSYDIGESVPDFELPTTSGESVRLSDHRGRPVLIFFTTTWCPYCSAEAPFLEREIWQRYRDRGLQVLSIQVKEGSALAGAFVGHHGWTFPVLVDEDGAVSERFAPRKEGLPPEVAIINAHFVLDGEGVVVHRDFLNMERFDAKATHVRAFLDEFLGVRS
ncbi:MAG TPA: TlpA disulfide reductase family protein [Actinomycetota bacterium]|jgi:peroxiredoxin|nr:TlpA disulfide reductase family protein [Actinomycetota bacterium]